MLDPVRMCMLAACMYVYESVVVGCICHYRIKRPELWARARPPETTTKGDRQTTLRQRVGCKGGGQSQAAGSLVLVLRRQDVDRQSTVAHTLSVHTTRER